MTRESHAAPLYKDPRLSPRERAEDLVGRMTLEEKVAQMVHEAVGVERLDLPDYNWWNECLHGVARAGRATVFPQAIGLAAAFDTTLIRRVAEAIAEEARAKHHQALRQGNRGQYFGLTFWTPNINIFRDPRWGRGQETYGEDPHLTARLGVAFVRGLQGDHPEYLKCVATPKHYAVHSGPEGLRHSFDAKAGPRDLRETYLPAFKACVVEGGAWSVMGAYNRTNGEVCCGSKTLLEDILRGEWGFRGYVVSDCGAVSDFHLHHKVTANPAESAALAVKHGCDLNCGCTFNGLLMAVDEDLIDEEQINESVARLMEARIRLGMFDPPERVPWAAAPAEVVGCEEHRRLALKAARESVVLLKNDGDLLPLSKALRKVLLVGPNACGHEVLQANYYGYSDRLVTPLDGILGKLSVGTQIQYVRGCDWTNPLPRDLATAVTEAQNADVVIACMGISPRLEGEEGDAALSDAASDRLDIRLPDCQTELLARLAETGTPVVCVLFAGSAVAANWEAENLPAVLYAWYPGEQGGAALADVLFGDYNPAGRMPVTVPKSLDDLPPFEDYAMAGRTYRFSTAEPLWPFGYGLSYTTYEYANLRLSANAIEPDESVTVTVEVANTGTRTGNEIVQLYVRDVEASVPVPRRHLAGFQRVHLAPGERQSVAFTLTPDQLVCYDDEGRPFVEPGVFELSLGGGQPDDPNSGALTIELTVK